MMKASQIIKINLLKTISLSIVNPLLEIYQIMIYFNKKIYKMKLKLKNVNYNHEGKEKFNKKIKKNI